MTAEDRLKCDEWLKAHVKHWQTHRRGTWQYRWKGRTLVRYLDNVSMRELQDGLVLEYLCSPDCMDTLSLYSQDVSKEWTPVNAWYETQPMRPSTNGIAQVRLYHALKVDVESDGDGPYAVENGCMWKVSWQFYWKQTSVIDLPESSSGVNYRISNLRRDDEDGTFDYVLERRERVQQDIDMFLAEVDEFHERRHEEHLGVKGSTSAGGKAASLDASRGVRVTRTVRKNEDCTHDVINDTIKELKAEGSSTETRRTIRSKTTTTVNRGMPEKASEANVGVGCSVRNDLTENGRWNQTIVNSSGSPVPDIRESCTKTAFRHDHSSTDVVDNDPHLSHVPDVATDPGTIVERSVTKNDDGTFDVSTSTRKDIAVERAETVVRATLNGVTKTTVDRNQPSPAPQDNLRVGTSVTNRMTDSGRYDVTHDEILNEDVDNTVNERAETALESRAANTSVKVDPEPIDDMVEREDGTTVDATVQMTDVGTFRVTKQTRTGKLGTAETVSGSAKRTVTSTSYQNSTEEELSGIAPDVNRDVDKSSTKNAFGLYDGRVTVVNHKTRTAVANYGNMLVDEKLTETSHDVDPTVESVPVEGKIFNVSISQNESGSFDKHVVERTAKPYEWVVEVDTNMAYSYTVFFRNVSQAKMQANIAKLQAKCSELVDRWSSQSRDPSNYHVYPSVNVNEFGLFDGSVQFQATWSPGSAGQRDEIDKVVLEQYYAATGYGSSKAGVHAKGRGFNALQRMMLRRWTGAGASLNISWSYDEQTQCWTYSDSICLYDKDKDK